MKRKILLTFIVGMALSAVAFAQQSIDRARAEFDSGGYAKAAELFKEISDSDPKNVEALAGLVDSLDAQGKWRDAIEPLNKLTSLQPDNTARLAQLGKYESWSNHRDHALQLLGTACTKSDDAAICTSYANVLSWASKNRPAAVDQLRDIRAKHPRYVPALTKLAEILSWDKATYIEALRLYAAAVEIEPRNASVLALYADALSSGRGWSKATLEYYDRALASDPKNTNSLVGKAQQLAWSGKSTDAITLYDQALAVDPDNALALCGKAEIYNWRGEYKTASDLLARARASAPDDARITAELVRAQIGLQQLDQARTNVAKLPANHEYREVRENVFRLVAPWVEVGASVRRNRKNLDYERLNVTVSSLLGTNNRLKIRYSPALFSTAARDFNSNSYNAELSSRLGAGAAMKMSAGVENYIGLDPVVVGNLMFQFKPSSSVEIHAAFDRITADDSLLSTRGTDVAGKFIGQVTSNLGTIGMSYSNRKHAYDFSMEYSDGYYLGRGLDDNRSWQANGQIGKSFGGAPYFRIAYGATYASFEYDAESNSMPSQYGDYFSPQRYLLNYGALTISHKFGNRFEADATGTGGAQQVESSTASFDHTQFASSFVSHAVWKVSKSNDFRFEYQFLNVYNAFRRNLVTASWRHYF